jgi:dihydroorotate dehydrogenase (NAD+) catalytic subunit
MLNAIRPAGDRRASLHRRETPELRRLGATNVINICGSTLDEYVETRAYPVGCRRRPRARAGTSRVPNIKEGGITFGCSLHGTFDVVKAVKKVTHLPVIPKLTPNVTDVASIAKAAEDAGADAVSHREHVPGDGDRHRNTAPQTLEYRWRPEWPCDQADRRAHGCTSAVEP